MMIFAKKHASLSIKNPNWYFMRCFIVLFLSFSVYAHAQYSVTGVIKDANDNSPIPHATAALIRSDSSVVTGRVSNDDGKFVIESVAAGDYLLQVSFLGYEKVNRRVNVPVQSDLGDILLSESTNKLNEVVVSADRPLVENRADRYIVNVSGNIQSAGRDALDILRNTPGLLVDHKGNISLMGNSVQVWIDGRPSQMSGEQLQVFLNSMQGGEIDRIEVITNPSSRYDAEGGGGIIDIRTKKGLQLGANGTLTAGYKQGRKDNQNAGVNLNWRREKFNLFGNYSVNRLNTWKKDSEMNVMQTSVGEITFDQYSTLESSNVFNHSVRAGMDYFLNPKNILGFIVNAYSVGGGQTDSEGITHISPTYNGIDFSTSNNTMTKNENGIQVNTNYQHTFTKSGQQLNIDLDYARFDSEQLQQTANSYYDPNGTMVGILEQLRHKAPRIIDVYSAKIDYTQPLWKDARMETGAKVSQTKTDNDLKYDVLVGNDWQIDANRTNRFVYSEQIDAAYINLNQQLGKFNLQAGLRGEYTLSKGKQKTTGEGNDTTYFNLFPTFFVNYQASQKHAFGISYSHRLSRPSYDILNPFEVAIDAYSFITGNPYLTPAYTHNIQLSHTFAQALMTRIRYSNITDMIMQIPVEDAATQRHGLSYGNFGKMQSYTAMVNYRKTFFKIWTANMTIQGAYSINTSNEASGEFINKGTSLYAQLNNNITITPTLSAELTGMYASRRRFAYYVTQPVGNFSIGFRQTLLKNKMTLSLTVNDILYTMSKATVRAQYENVNYSSRSEYDNRYVNLTLRYNFGSTTVREARNKSTGIEDEASRAGSR
jgi:hypothetical protein